MTTLSKLQFVMCARRVTPAELAQLFPSATAYTIHDFGRGFDVALPAPAPQEVEQAKAALRPWQVYER